MPDSLPPQGPYPPGSSVHGILQARILDWVAISFSRGSSRTGDRTGSPALQVGSVLSEPARRPSILFFFFNILFHYDLSQIQIEFPVLYSGALLFAHPVYDT